MFKQNETNSRRFFGKKQPCHSAKLTKENAGLIQAKTPHSLPSSHSFITTTTRTLTVSAGTNKHSNPHPKSTDAQKTEKNQKNQKNQNKAQPPKNPSKTLKGKEEFSSELRRLQTEWMEHRLRRPFFSGMTTNGLNYIDTRPSDDNNTGTVLNEHIYTPSPDNPVKTGLKRHTKIPENQIMVDQNDTFDPPLNSKNSPHSHTSPDSQHSRHNSPHSNPTSHAQPSPQSHKLPSEQGITVLLAHGYSFGYGMWSENFDTISQLPGVNRVVAFDWRGMGGSLRHIDDGPIRSSVSILERYKHDTFVSSPQEAIIRAENKKTKKLKNKLCKKHFGKYFSSEQEELNNDSPQDGNHDSSSHRFHRQKLNNLIKDYVYNPDSSYTPQKAIDYFIDPLLQLFKELKLTDQPVIVVAHSLGGYLSTNFVHKYPGLAHSLVLASPVGVCESYGLENNYEHQSFQQFAVSAIKQEDRNFGRGFLQKNQPNKETPKQDLKSDQSPLTNDSNTLPNPSNHAHYFPLRVLPTLPRHIQPHAENSDGSVQINSPHRDQSSQTSQTSLEVSPKRLTQPLILRNPIIQLIHFLWQTNNTPQSLLRGLPTRFGYSVSTSLASRMHPPGTLTEQDEKLLINYLHHIFTAPPSGEHALNSILHIDYPSYRARNEWKQYKKLVKLMEGFGKNEENGMGILDENSSSGKRKRPGSGQPGHDNNYSKPISGSLLQDDENASIEASDDSESDFENVREVNSMNNDHSLGQTRETNEHNNDAKKDPKNDHNFEKLITPSVFARKPLTDILYDVNIPTHFLFGSHDWLFHKDVPYIIGSLHSHFKDPQTIEFLHDKSLHTALSKGIESYQGEGNERTQLSGNIGDKNRANDAQGDGSVININNKNQRSKIIDQFNLHPDVTLTVLPQSGHHVYVNNIKAFNLALHNSILDFSTKVLNSNKQKYNQEYQNNFSQNALEKYYDEFQTHVKNEEEKRLQKELKSCKNVAKSNLNKGIETLTKHIEYMFSKDLIKTLFNTSKDLPNTTHPPETFHNPTNNEQIDLHTGLYMQPSQVLTSKCPVQRLHRFRPPRNPANGGNIKKSNQIDSNLLPFNESLVSPLEHAATSSLLSHENDIPQGRLKSHICKYAKFVYFGKGYSYNGVNNSHFDRFHKFAKSVIVRDQQNQEKEQLGSKETRD
jgi:pimeloyl-ACP methyl ester carboxylesterase